MPHALLVDDDSGSVRAMTEIVKKEGFSTATARCLAEAREKLQERVPDVILLDMRLPDGDGMDLLREIEDVSAIEVVLVTAFASVDSAIDAMRSGAADYLTKPVDIPRLRAVLTHVKRTQEFKAQIKDLRAELIRLGRFGSLLGSSPSMQHVYYLIGKAAPTDVTVLLTGESGTGKEVVARTIHELSSRRKNSFLPLDCAGVSPNLIESELFGHERGSFTSATQQHRGYFETADGGTVFLDEITEMPMELQAKLLRVLEMSTFTRVGGVQQIRVNVRVIAATNRSLDDAVAEGKLRRDLLYRLKVFPIRLPPLRDRGDDPELLAKYFLQEFCREQETSKTFSKAALDLIRRYTWPGNVRELRNVVHQAMLLCEGDEVLAENLPPELTGQVEVIATESKAVARETAVNDKPAIALQVGTSIADANRQLILATIENHGGDKKAAAKTLGVSVRTLYNRLKTFEGS